MNLASKVSARFCGGGSERGRRCRSRRPVLAPMVESDPRPAIGGHTGGQEPCVVVLSRLMVYEG